MEMTDEALTELNRKIAVMEAYRDGREIQHKYIGQSVPAVDTWADSTPPHAAPQWLWTMYDYRVKPIEPQKLVGLRYQGETVHSAWCDLHRAGVEFNGMLEGCEKVEFIEVTPEIRKVLNL